MLPFGYTLEDLKAGVSKIRNRVIARVFHELEFMEEWGSGFKRCREDCIHGGYPIPEWQELGAAVRVIFAPHPQTRGKEISQRVIFEPLDRQKAILALFKRGSPLSFREISKLLSKPIPERTLRNDLAILRDKKLLIAIGKGRATLWRLVD